MKVKKHIILITALLCIGYTGCAKEQTKTNIEKKAKSEDIGQAKQTASKQDFPERFQETINGVSFDMDIQIST